MTKKIGFDLGTTNSSGSCLDTETGEIKVIKNLDGHEITPTFMCFEDGEWTFGDVAKHGALAMPERTLSGFKPLMGATDSSGNYITIAEIDGKSFTAVDASAMMLRYLKECIYQELGEVPSDVVITVPADFGDAARTATITAGKIAGFENITLLSEPTAGALTYGRETDLDQKTICVYDFGGGTFDVSIITVDGNSVKVIATSGDSELGGNDVTNCIVEYSLDTFEEKHGFRPSPDEDAAQFADLIDRSERAKIDLSRRKKVNVVWSARGREIKITISRGKFEELIRPLIDRTIELTKKTIQDAGLKQEDLILIPIGGSSRIPYADERLRNDLGLEPLTVGVDRDLAVAMGAAHRAGMGDLVEDVAEGGLTSLSDVCCHSLGVEVVDGTGNKVVSVIIPKNTPLPTKFTEKYALESDLQTTARITVVTGEEGVATDDPSAEIIGKVLLKGLPVKLPRTERISLSLGYDMNGVIEVNAADTISGKSINGKLEYRPGLDQEQIEQAREEVEGALSTIQ